MPTKSSNSSASAGEDNRVFFIIAYVLSLVTGIIVLFMKGDEDQRLKLHSMQSIFLGIVWIVGSVILGLIPFIGAVLSPLFSLLIWLYGLYVGFEGYNGHDLEIPVITDYAKRYSGFNEKKPADKK